jgi:hypothetical protein
VTNGWKEILADLQNESDENVALKVIKHIQAVANFLNSQQKVKLTGDIDMFLKNYKEGKLRMEMEEVVE